MLNGGIRNIRKEALLLLQDVHARCNAAALLVRRCLDTCDVSLNTGASPKTLVDIDAQSLEGRVAQDDDTIIPGHDSERERIERHQPQLVCKEIRTGSVFSATSSTRPSATLSFPGVCMPSTMRTSG